MLDRQGIVLGLGGGFGVRDVVRLIGQVGGFLEIASTLLLVIAQRLDVLPPTCQEFLRLLRPGSRL